ncbi:aromatic amino acid aminotransferase [Actibacterium mucosum KCTC 23349]|uniref:Aminotransferase n=1 Tax=Actibacterium mucosum KCTC 23349 TaxID=1454373 RepID=A0A037ZLK1_9RHOB|nr:amino acid aminotransferase [Actibacterium mucosum]KAJ56964.1 aromatic amino acid aminotransferase [Actibacterium mucosum KCTC 23349]
MFDQLTQQPKDKILALMQQFREDPRPGKIDLGVGVYRNAEGVTPVMRAIRAAGAQWQQDETTKAYTSLAGDAQFLDGMCDLILADTAPRDRMASVATVGGTGAIHQALELIKSANPAARVWLSNPTWPNHPAILRHVGLQAAEYRYFDNESRAVDFGAMMTDLQGLAAGDVVLLHGCCHNPTGANLTMPEWTELAGLLLSKGAIPLIDIAYQGFGDGLDEDAAPTRMLAGKLPEMLIAASCSKNFGVYRDRAGILMTICASSADAALAQNNLATLNRLNYSFPPDHGARLVGLILSDPTLRADWQAELEEVRNGMLTLRTQLADALQIETGSNRFGFLAQHRGMFSRLGATPEQIETLRDTHAIYIIGDSRMNIAGLNAETVPLLASAIARAGI